MNSEDFEKMLTKVDIAIAEAEKKLQLDDEPSKHTETHTLVAIPEYRRCSTCKDDPFSRQVGGSHYTQYKISPYEFFYKNNIPHHKAAIIRRILRFDHETGKGMVDLDKITHEVELIKKLWREEKEVEENATPSDPS